MVRGPIGRGQPPHAQLLSEINVTPLVDVMLVLLVIFMITAPLAVTGVKVDLPQARTQNLASDQKPLMITINAAGEIFIGDAAVARASFDDTLRQMAAASGDPGSMRVFVRADRSLAYGSVMQIIAEIGAAGFVKVAFLSDSGAAPIDKVVP